VSEFVRRMMGSWTDFLKDKKTIALMQLEILRPIMESPERAAAQTDNNVKAIQAVSNTMKLF
jgi:hypothetical protein